MLRVHRRECVACEGAFDSEDPDWLQRNANGDTCDGGLGRRDSH